MIKKYNNKEGSINASGEAEMKTQPLLFTLLFQKYCKMSSLCHAFLLSLTFLHLLPALPICVATWMNPLLSVKMAGILSPMAQQLPSVLVNRRSSASFPFLRLAPSNELMYRSMEILKEGPQVGIVDTRLFRAIT